MEKERKEKTLTFPPLPLKKKKKNPKKRKKAHLSLSTSSSKPPPPTTTGQPPPLVRGLLRPHPVPRPLPDPGPEKAEAGVGLLFEPGTDPGLAGRESRDGPNAARGAGAGLDREHSCRVCSCCCCCCCSRCCCCGERQQQRRRRQQQRRSSLRGSPCCSCCCCPGEVLFRQAQAYPGQAPFGAEAVAGQGARGGDRLKERGRERCFWFRRGERERKREIKTFLCRFLLYFFSFPSPLPFPTRSDCKHKRGERERESFSVFLSIYKGPLEREKEKKNTLTSLLLRAPPCGEPSPKPAVSSPSDLCAGVGAQPASKPPPR